MLGAEGAAEVAAWCQAWEGERRGGGEGLLGPQGGSQAPARHGPCSLQEEAKAKEEEGVPDEEGWVKVTRRGRRPVLPRTEAASLRVLERERRKRARKELLNFYAWQHRETKMERKAPQGPVLHPTACVPGPWSCGRSASPGCAELPGLLGWERGPRGLPAPPKPSSFTSGCVLEVEGITEGVFFFIWCCWVLNVVSRLLTVMGGSLSS